jgi:putative hydrolase of the HAD superfamily
MDAAAIRNVVFDFGGVLVRWAPQEIINNFYVDEPLRELAKSAIFRHPDWLEMDRGMLNEDDAARRFSERMGRPVDEMAVLLANVRESLTPIPETIELLHDFAEAGMPLYGLSNMPWSTFEFLRARDPHWSLFRGVVISGEVKMIKPDAKIFEHIARTYDLDPAESLFLDDLQPNIEAAKRAGFQAMLFDDPQRCSAELRRLFNLNAR